MAGRIKLTYLGAAAARFISIPVGASSLEVQCYGGGGPGGNASGTNGGGGGGGAGYARKTFTVITAGTPTNDEVKEGDSHRLNVASASTAGSPSGPETLFRDAADTVDLTRANGGQSGANGTALNRGAGGTGGTGTGTTTFTGGAGGGGGTGTNGGGGGGGAGAGGNGGAGTAGGQRGAAGAAGSPAADYPAGGQGGLGSITSKEAGTAPGGGGSGGRVGDSTGAGGAAGQAILIFSGLPQGSDTPVGAITKQALTTSRSGTVTSAGVALKKPQVRDKAGSVASSSVLLRRPRLPRGGSDTPTGGLTKRSPKTIHAGSIGEPVTFSDNFNRADEQLTTSANWTGVSNSTIGQVVSNQLTTNAAGFFVARHSSDLASADMWADVDVLSHGANGNIIGVALRVTDAQNYFRIGYNPATSRLLINRVLTGTTTTLAEIVDPAITPPYRLRGQAVGDTLKLFMNGRELLSVDDSNHNTIKRAGVVIGSEGAILDDFRTGVDPRPLTGAVTKFYPKTNHASSLSPTGEIVRKIFARSLAAAISSAGAVTKFFPKTNHGGADTPTSTLRFKPKTNYAGADTPTGVVAKRQIFQGLASTLTSTGALVRKVFIRDKAGAVTPSGALLNKPKLAGLAGSIASAATVIFKPKTNYAGTTTTSGVISPFRVFFRGLAGSDTPTSALTKKPIIPRFAGAISSSGELIRRPHLVLASAISSSSAIIQKVKITLASSIDMEGLQGFFFRLAGLGGSITPSSTVTKAIDLFTPFSGSDTPSGAVLNKPKLAGLAGSVSSSGETTKRPRKVFLSALSSAGTIIQKVASFFSGSVDSSGAITKKPSTNYEGIISPTEVVGSDPTKFGSGMLEGVGILTASGGVIVFGDAAIAGEAEVLAAGHAVTTTVNGFAALEGSATLAGVGQQVVSGVVAIQGVATVAGAGAIGDGGQPPSGSAHLTGEASVAAVGKVEVVGIAAITGEATVLGHGHPDTGEIYGFAGLVGEASVTAVPAITVLAQASIVGAATLGSDGTIITPSVFGFAGLEGVAAVSGVGQVIVVGQGVITGEATLAGAGTGASLNTIETQAFQLRASSLSTLAAETEEKALVASTVRHEIQASETATIETSSSLETD